MEEDYKEAGGGDPSTDQEDCDMAEGEGEEGVNSLRNVTTTAISGQDSEGGSEIQFEDDIFSVSATYLSMASLCGLLY